MVKYNVGNIDPEGRQLGMYVVRTKATTRGVNKGNVTSNVYQVRKAKNGTQAWSLVKKLSAGRPKPLSARLLGLQADAKAIKAFNDGKAVFIQAAFDQNGENPTSFFRLKRRKQGDEYVYYYSAVQPEALLGSASGSRSASPNKKLKKPTKRSKKAKKE